MVRNHELLSRSAQTEASVTNGQVSGFNTDAIGQDVIQTDAAAAHGNSGGPAVADDATVIGIMRPGERRLNVVSEGELLGEMALFRKAPRSASAVAVTDAELLVVQNERLGWLIRNRPELTIELLKRLSDQIVSRDADPIARPDPPSVPPDPPGSGPTT